jgi:hypothetical protein
MGMYRCSHLVLAMGRYIVDGHNSGLGRCRRVHRLAGRKGSVVLHIYKSSISIFPSRVRDSMSSKAGLNCDRGSKLNVGRLTRTAT